jgi:hypothetical protein
MNSDISEFKLWIFLPSTVNISGNSKTFSGSSTVITKLIYWWIQLLAVYPISSTLFFVGGHLGLAVFCGVSQLLKMVLPPIDVCFWSASHIGYGMFSHWHLLHICSFSGTIATFTPKKYDTLLTYKASITWQNIHMGYIYKVNTYGYKVDWWDWQSGSRNRWCKAYEGFYYTVGKKRNRYGANVNERTSHLRIDWLIKNRHIVGHTIFNKWDTPQNTVSPTWPPTKNKVDR